LSCGPAAGWPCSRPGMICAAVRSCPSGVVTGGDRDLPFEKAASDGGAAAVGGDGRAGEVAGLRRGEECDDLGDLGGLGGASSRWSRRSRRTSRGPRAEVSVRRAMSCCRVCSGMNGTSVRQRSRCSCRSSITCSSSAIFPMMFLLGCGFRRALAGLDEGTVCGAGTYGGTVQGPGGGSGMAAVISTLRLTRGDRGSAISAVVQPPIELPVTVTSCSPSARSGRCGAPRVPECRPAVGAVCSAEAGWAGTSTHTWCVVASNSPDPVTG
jgi:hypothetical protein